MTRYSSLETRTEVRSLPRNELPTMRSDNRFDVKGVGGAKGCGGLQLLADVPANLMGDFCKQVLQHRRIPVVLLAVGIRLNARSVRFASAAVVISARNAVHSVLFLILAFVNGAGLFVLLGAEFLAMILIVVYVGAVAVLFLFVVMMLDIDFGQMRDGFVRYLPVGGVVFLILLAELVFEAVSWAFGPPGGVAGAALPAAGISNTRALGDILYTRYLFAFQSAGLILLVAMIGAIVLTLRRRGDLRRQSIAAQVARSRAETVEVVKVPVGEGV